MIRIFINNLNLLEIKNSKKYRLLFRKLIFRKIILKIRLFSANMPLNAACHLFLTTWVVL